MAEEQGEELKLMRFHPYRARVIRGRHTPLTAEEVALRDFIEEWLVDVEDDGPIEIPGLRTVEADEARALREHETVARQYAEGHADAGGAIVKLTPEQARHFRDTPIDDVEVDEVSMSLGTIFIWFGGDMELVPGGPLFDGMYIEIEGDPLAAALNGNGSPEGITMYATPVAPWIEQAVGWSFLKRIREDAKLGYVEEYLDFDDGESFDEICAAPFINVMTQVDELTYLRSQRALQAAYKRAGEDFEIVPYHMAMAACEPTAEDLAARDQFNAMARIAVNTILRLRQDLRDERTADAG